MSLLSAELIRADSARRKRNDRNHNGYNHGVDNHGVDNDRGDGNGTYHMEYECHNSDNDNNAQHSARQTS